MRTEHRPASRVFATVALIVVGLTAQACAVEGLAFVEDDRVSITSPREGDEISLPFEVRWQVEDYDGRYGVFFDRSPMRPGQHLLALVPESDTCRSEPGCPDAVWLEERDVYVTDATRVRIERLPDRRKTDRAKDRHDVTIVLLDDDGRRAGESAFTVEFIVERED